MVVKSRIRLAESPVVAGYVEGRAVYTTHNTVIARLDVVGRADAPTIEALLARAYAWGRAMLRLCREGGILKDLLAVISCVLRVTDSRQQHHWRIE